MLYQNLEEIKINLRLLKLLNGIKTTKNLSNNKIFLTLKLEKNVKKLVVSLLNR